MEARSRWPAKILGRDANVGQICGFDSPRSGIPGGIRGISTALRLIREVNNSNSINCASVMLADDVSMTLNMDAVHANLARLKRDLLLSISLDAFICLFESIEACDAILMGGLWVISGFIIGLDCWSSSFSPQLMVGLSSSVWICLPYLLLMYWDNTNLAQIASFISQPLWVDAQIKSWGINAFARVFVRRDLGAKFLPGVWISGLHGKTEGYSPSSQVSNGEVGEPAKQVASSRDGDLSNIPFKFSTEAFLLHPRRFGPSKDRVSMTHFAKELQHLEPITNHPRKKKEGGGDASQ
ncbi:hypothetical protein M5K25_024748 [Dendrobium thyrsiflorum]|uniref:Uncharacterized protein n=1 Tax=Dendrobium thyrsiflorum TaxID=117978 RepID=A0ABD0U2U6_DENTH